MSRSRSRSWPPFLACLAMTGIGVAMQWSSDRSSARGGIAVAAFFGMGALVLGLTMVRSVRMRRNLGAREVAVRPGVRLRTRRGRLYALAFLLTLVGAAGVWGGEAITIVFQVVSGAIGVFGVVVAAMVALGLHLDRALTFLPEGLRYEDRGLSLLVPWSRVGRLDLDEYAHNPIIRLTLFQPEDLPVESRAGAGPDDRARARFDRLRVKNRTWLGCDLALFPWHFGLDPVLLSKAIVGYVSDPDRRAELARSLPEPPRGPGV